MTYSFLELLIFFWLTQVDIYCLEFISHPNKAYLSTIPVLLETPAFDGNLPISRFRWIFFAAFSEQWRKSGLSPLFITCRFFSCSNEKGQQRGHTKLLQILLILLTMKLITEVVQMFLRESFQDLPPIKWLSRMSGKNNIPLKRLRTTSLNVIVSNVLKI